jgi:hypothetical protein
MNAQIVTNDVLLCPGPAILTIGYGERDHTVVRTADAGMHASVLLSST